MEILRDFFSHLVEGQQAMKKAQKDLQDLFIAVSHSKARYWSQSSRDRTNTKNAAKKSRLTSHDKW